MSKSIHGRNVIKLMKEQNTPQPQQQWLALMAEEFGENAEFHTCQASDMAANQLVELFISNGRLTETEAGFVINQCGHCAGKEGHAH
ncbi:YecH family protein [Shewanella donghaensis]|uniref:YecH family protein n=1 Tax=Shewanella donghaensis TaxID=238836 RepID=UPI0011845A6F|nr:YecH family protein [Shewanella donghaensis]